MARFSMKFRTYDDDIYCQECGVVMFHSMDGYDTHTGQAKIFPVCLHPDCENGRRNRMLPQFGGLHGTEPQGQENNT